MEHLFSHFISLSDFVYVYWVGLLCLPVLKSGLCKRCPMLPAVCSPLVTGAVCSGVCLCDCAPLCSDPCVRCWAGLATGPLGCNALLYAVAAGPLENRAGLLHNNPMACGCCRPTGAQGRLSRAQLHSPADTVASGPLVVRARSPRGWPHGLLGHSFFRLTVWGAQCGTQDSHFLGRTFAVVIFLLFVNHQPQNVGPD